jgi:hypothetical protein
MAAEGLNAPTKIQALTRNKLYVLDFNARKILLLNVNLRPVRVYDFFKQSFTLPETGTEISLYPADFTINPLSELYIQHFDDYKIYKFDSSDRLELRFGGAGYGKGSLLGTVQLTSSPDSFTEITIVAADTARQTVHVYDRFGAYRNAITIPQPERWQSVRLLGHYVFVWSRNYVSVYDSQTNTTKTFAAPAPIADVAPRRDAFYILYTNRTIKAYRPS